MWKVTYVCQTVSTHEHLNIFCITYGGLEIQLCKIHKEGYYDSTDSRYHIRIRLWSFKAEKLIFKKVVIKYVPLKTGFLCFVDLKGVSLLIRAWIAHRCPNIHS